MFRWLVRFSGAALIGALLVWFWNRYNQDLLEEEQEEEIPVEFDVAAGDMALSMPEGALNDTATNDGISATPTGEAGSSAEVSAATSRDSAAAASPPDTAAERAPEEVATEATAEESTAEPEPVLDSAAPTPVGAGDNVMAIKGIGPKYAEKLAEMGITTFGALLGTPLDTLAMTFPRVSGEELENWLEQARELAEPRDETA